MKNLYARCCPSRFEFGRACGAVVNEERLSLLRSRATMAPKPKEPEPPPPPPPAPPATSWEDEWESEEVVSSIVDELVVGAEEVLAQKALRAAVAPFTADRIFAKMRAAIECRFVDHDAGEPELASAPNWKVGAEPVPALIDAWSRGAVPAKKPAPMSQPAGESLSSTDPPGSPRAKTPAGSVRGEARERVPDYLPLPDPKGPVFIAKLPPGTVIVKPEKKPPVVTATEKLRRRLEAEAREERAKLAQLELDLKARQFVYAAPSNVIVLEEVQPDKLPAFQQQPKLGIAGQRGGTAAPSAATPSKGKKGEAPAKKGSKLEFGGKATFKQLDSLQPPLLESMDVREGVLLKQGPAGQEATKGGEARIFDGERMSKTAFEQALSNPGGFKRRAAPPKEDPAGGAPDPTLGNTGPPPTTVPTPDSPGSQVVARRPPHMPNSPGPEEKHGTKNAHTRERGGMPINDRLPPPALGATTGHGQGLPYCGQQLTSSSVGGVPRSLTASETLRVTNAEALRGLVD